MAFTKSKVVDEVGVRALLAEMLNVVSMFLPSVDIFKSVTSGGVKTFDGSSFVVGALAVIFTSCSWFVRARTVDPKIVIGSLAMTLRNARI